MRHGPALRRWRSGQCAVYRRVTTELCGCHGTLEQGTHTLGSRGWSSSNTPSWDVPVGAGQEATLHFGPGNKKCSVDCKPTLLSILAARPSVWEMGRSGPVAGLYLQLKGPVGKERACRGNSKSRLKPKVQFSSLLPFSEQARQLRTQTPESDRARVPTSLQFSFSAFNVRIIQGTVYRVLV